MIDASKAITKRGGWSTPWRGWILVSVLMDRSTFIRYLDESGLLTDRTVRVHVDDPSTQSLDGHGLARVLIQSEALTPFQANQILSGKARDLRLGDYRLVERLGHGGMGQVYKAIQGGSGRTVAIKVLSRHLVQDPRALARFRREIEAYSNLKHPHIVTAHEATEYEGIQFLVMEYVEGADLGRLVKEIGPLPLELACHCIHQAALGLQHAHERGLVHRDLKPSNVFLQARWQTSGSMAGRRKLVYGKVKLLDLGLARFLERPRETLQDGRMVTQLNQIMGTPDYMSPEQGRDSHSADARSDIYSLGATLYFCLTGRPPFAEGAALEKLMMHQTEAPVPVEELRRNVTTRLALLVKQMLAKDPAARPQTAAMVAAALENWRRPPTVLMLPAKPATSAEQSPPDAVSDGTGSLHGLLQFMPKDARLVRRNQPGTSWPQLILFGLTLGAVSVVLAVLLLIKLLR